jgi:hypothetical protein
MGTVQMQGLEVFQLGEWSVDGRTGIIDVVCWGRTALEDGNYELSFKAAPVCPPIAIMEQGKGSPVCECFCHPYDKVIFLKGARGDW